MSRSGSRRPPCPAARRSASSWPRNWLAARTGNTLYILDEPTTGLHFEDVRKLLEVLHALVEQGNTVVVIEHNLDVFKTEDHIIDLGPEGGVKGGEIVAVGTPEQVVKEPRSYTGKYLAPLLGDARGRCGGGGIGGACSLREVSLPQPSLRAQRSNPEPRGKPRIASLRSRRGW